MINQWIKTPIFLCLRCHFAYLITHYRASVLLKTIGIGADLIRLDFIKAFLKQEIFNFLVYVERKEEYNYCGAIPFQIGKDES